MTLFKAILSVCGLSRCQAAEFLDVRPDTVQSWVSGRDCVPETVIDELAGLYAHQVAASEKIITGEMDAAVAADDCEARRLGWPCVSAQMTAIAMARMTEVAIRR